MNIGWKEAPQIFEDCLNTCLVCEWFSIAFSVNNTNGDRSILAEELLVPATLFFEEEAFWDVLLQSIVVKNVNIRIGH